MKVVLSCGGLGMRLRDDSEDVPKPMVSVGYRPILWHVMRGLFVLRRWIFDWMKEGEELVQEPFQRLAAAGKLLAYPYDGSWDCVDTFNDKQLLEDLHTRGQVPWEVWKRQGGPGNAAAPTATT